MSYGAKSKYRAVRTAGFASKREAEEMAKLQILEKAGKIRNLRFQVPFDLLPADAAKGYRLPLRYVADAVFEEDHGKGWENRWPEHVVDVKGFRTDVYKIKKRLMEQLLGIVVEEL